MTKLIGNKNLTIVAIYVSGGVIQDTSVYPAETPIAIKIVNWDDLNEEGIACPSCGGNDLMADPETDQNDFVCLGCDTKFEWASESERRSGEYQATIIQKEE
jgi:hypothetical protein